MRFSSSLELHDLFIKLTRGPIISTLLIGIITITQVYQICFQRPGAYQYNFDKCHREWWIKVRQILHALLYDILFAAYLLMPRGAYYKQIRLSPSVNETLLC